jgi:ABC-type multidrug transport system ATPase subunit
MNQGERIHLSGPNGCGKSVFLKSVAHLLPSTFESFYVEQQAVSDWKIELLRSRLMYVPPQVMESDLQTVDDFFTSALKFKINSGLSFSIDIEKYLLDFGIREKKLSLLSSGQKQLIHLLRVVGLPTKILLLDEPFSNLDEVGLKNAVSLLEKWQERNLGSMVLVSHQLEASKMLGCTRVMYSDLCLNA